jgi:DNA-binding PadR family transcriptional regulator
MTEINGDAAQDDLHRHSHRAASAASLLDLEPNMQDEKKPFEVPELTTIEYYILAVLLTSARHGLGIFEAVAKRTDNQVILVPGTLYAALKRMYERGWIAVTDPPDAEGRSDERRKFYRVTPKGRQLVAAYAAWMETELTRIRDDLERTSDADESDDGPSGGTSQSDDEKNNAGNGTVAPGGN